MAKKRNLSPKYQAWIDARKRFHLSHDHIRMARELGLNPKKFGKLANHKQEPWKLPLPEYIEYLYLKHFNKEPLKNSLSIENLVKLKKQKNAERKERKRQEKAKETIEHVPATNPEYDDIPF